jgi:preprotein translocase SecF subunit
VFNLTSKKYWFFGLSGIVILPGLLALIIWGLNTGIDFTGGATVDLRFATSNPELTTQVIGNAFKAAHAHDVQVLASTDLSGATQASQYAYIRFSRPIGPNEAKAVLNLLADPKANLPPVQTNSVHTFYLVTCPDTAKTATCPDGQKTTYGLMVVPFTQNVRPQAVQAALAHLPQTDAPPATGLGTPAGSTAATPTAVPQPTATAKPGATPAPTATATATATSGSSGTTATTFPVTVSDVKLGANANTYTVETQTFLQGTALDKIVNGLQQQYGYGFIQSTDQVGPSIASETTRNAIFAVFFASVAILTYIAIAFRKVGNARRAISFGACAIIALLHDALVVLGLWAIFGHFFDFKVDTLFVTAVLTVIGFSVHDTIVVFDRIRENLSRRTVETFDEIVNASLVQTMSRSLNTSLTVLFTLSALTLFGGASIRTFTLALLIGIASGTYSSIFNASMLLVVYESGEWRHWFGLKPKAAPVVYRRGQQLARASAR